MARVHGPTGTGAAISAVRHTCTVPMGVSTVPSSESAVSAAEFTAWSAVVTWATSRPSLWQAKRPTTLLVTLASAEVAPSAPSQATS